MATYFPDTPKKGKASHYSGELPPRDQAMYPGKRKNKSLQWCVAAARSGDVPRKKEKQVITVVSRRREIGSCTPEKGKTSHYSGELPPRD